jgi:hypothetical protein
VSRSVRVRTVRDTSFLMSGKVGFFLAGGLLLALSGCGNGAATDPAAPGAVHQAGPYFDLRGLLDAQVRQLAAHHPALTKQVSLRGGATETVRVPEVKWPDELQIFYQADINKAALRGAYQVDSTNLPSGATQQIYRLRPGHDNAAVLQLAVTSAGGQPQEIQAVLRQDNTLFFGQKNLHLTLDNGQLRTYGVSGTQKLVLFDTLRYRTQAQVQ